MGLALQIAVFVAILFLVGAAAIRIGAAVVAPRRRARPAFDDDGPEHDVSTAEDDPGPAPAEAAPRHPEAAAPVLLLLRAPLDAGAARAGAHPASHLGGAPGLPSGLAWPRDGDGAPLRFLLRLRGAELPPGGAPPCPESDLLVFCGEGAEGSAPTVAILRTPETAADALSSPPPAARPQPRPLGPPLASAPAPWPVIALPWDGAAAPRDLAAERIRLGDGRVLRDVLRPARIGDDGSDARNPLFPEAAPSGDAPGGRRFEPWALGAPAPWVALGAALTLEAVAAPLLAALAEARAGIPRDQAVVARAREEIARLDRLGASAAVLAPARSALETASRRIAAAERLLAAPPDPLLSRCEAARAALEALDLSAAAPLPPALQAETLSVLREAARRRAPQGLSLAPRLGLRRLMARAMTDPVLAAALPEAAFAAFAPELAPGIETALDQVLAAGPGQGEETLFLRLVPDAGADFAPVAGRGRLEILVPSADLRDGVFDRARARLV